MHDRPVPGLLSRSLPRLLFRSLPRLLSRSLRTAASLYRLEKWLSCVPVGLIDAVCGKLSPKPTSPHVIEKGVARKGREWRAHIQDCNRPASLLRDGQVDRRVARMTRGLKRERNTHGWRPGFSPWRV